ncbi:MAG: hypothetical protein ACP5OK_09900, partial [Thermoprotei archaeon]
SLFSGCLQWVCHRPVNGFRRTQALSKPYILLEPRIQFSLEPYSSLWTSGPHSGQLAQNFIVKRILKHFDNSSQS